MWILYFYNENLNRDREAITISFAWFHVNSCESSE